MLEQSILELSANIARLVAVLEARTLQAPVVAQPLAPCTPESVVADVKAAQAAQTVPEPVPEAKPAKAKAKPAPVAPAPPPITGDMVRTALLRLIDERGRDAAMAIFKAEGISRGSELAPDRYEAVYLEVSRLLGEGA